MRPAAIVVVALCATFQPSPSRADGFHCGTKLVSTGDSDAAVLAKCGEPDRRAPVLETHCLAPGWCQTVQVGERWTYDLGPDRLLRHLVFRDQKLAAVEQDGYGHRRRGLSWRTP